MSDAPKLPDGYYWFRSRHAEGEPYIALKQDGAWLLHGMNDEVELDETRTICPVRPPE